MDFNIYPPSQDRADYERVVKVVAEAMGATPEQVKAQYNIMPHTLRMGFYVNPTTSEYVVSPRKGVDTNAPLDSILLDQNDWFIGNQMGLRFSRADYASGAYSNHGNYAKLTYPDPVAFPYTGTAVGDEAKSLQTLVNGTVSVKVAGTPIIDGQLAQELCYNPDGTAVASPLAHPRFGGSPGDRGLFPLTPTLILNAMSDNAFTLNLSNGVKTNIDGNISTGTTAATTRNVVYFMLAGWKIKNLAEGGKLCKTA